MLKPYLFKALSITAWWISFLGLHFVIKAQLPNKPFEEVWDIHLLIVVLAIVSFIRGQESTQN